MLMSKFSLGTRDLFVRFLVLVLCFVAAIIVLAKISPVEAATYTVSKTADTLDGTCNADCSIREAVAAANGNAGNDTINFNIPTSDGGYVAASGGTQAYWQITTTSALTLSDNSGVTIDGYSQTGASRNTAAFGDTINTVLTIDLFLNVGSISFNMTGDNNHVTGLSIRTSSTSSSMAMDTSSNNWLEGNFLGSNITGTAASNGGSLRIINSSASNTIGTNGDGTGDVGERNLWAGSYTSTSVSGYITLLTTSGSNIIAGNYFGTDKTGNACTTKTLDAADIGISTAGNRIGTNLDSVSDSEEANLMGCVNGNYRAFIRLLAGANNNIIQGNYVGISPDGNALGTLFTTGVASINLSGTSISGNMIRRNVITSGAHGIRVQSSAAGNFNTFSQNSIFSNEKVGITYISSSGPMANDAGDVDTGANDLMNFPVINKAGISPDGNLLLDVNLDFNAAEAPFTLEFFGNDTLDTSLYGEGKYYIGTITTSATGNNIILSVPMTDYEPADITKVTSTATNINGATSEFSTIASDTTTYSTMASASLSINNGDTQTASTSVTLNIAATGEFSTISDMMISNNSDFSGASYEPYATTKSWTIPSGDGTKTVYIKFKDSQENESEAYSDTIILDTTPTPTPTSTPSPTPTPTATPTNTPVPTNTPNPTVAPTDSIDELPETGTTETPVPTQTPTPTSTPENGFTIKIKVVDDAGNPVVGALVTLYSEPKTAYTDKDGIATFYNVEAGEHRTVIEYDGKKTEQNFTVSAETASIDGNSVLTTPFKITISDQSTTNIFSSPLVITSLIIVAIIIVIAFKKRSDLRKLFE